MTGNWTMYLRYIEVKRVMIMYCIRVILQSKCVGLNMEMIVFKHIKNYIFDVNILSNHLFLFWKSLWGESVAWILYWIHWPRIYRIRSLAQCVANISYWLHLNEGFRCNGIKTNKYVIFVLCVSDRVKWSICDVIFVLKEKEEITLLLTVY